MDDERGDALRRVIRQAMANGYELERHWGSDRPIGFHDIATGALRQVDYNLLFQHAFAQALWGDDWQRHLAAMVLEPDPLDYLLRNPLI